MVFIEKLKSLLLFIVSLIIENLIIIEILVNLFFLIWCFRYAKYKNKSLYIIIIYYILYRIIFNFFLFLISLINDFFNFVHKFCINALILIQNEPKFLAYLMIFFILWAIAAILGPPPRNPVWYYYFDSIFYIGGIIISGLLVSNYLFDTFVYTKDQLGYRTLYDLFCIYLSNFDFKNSIGLILICLLTYIDFHLKKQYNELVDKDNDDILLFFIIFLLLQESVIILSFIFLYFLNKYLCKKYKWYPKSIRFFILIKC